MAGCLYAHQQAGSTLIPRVLIAESDAALRQRLYGRLLDIDVYSDCESVVADALARLDETEYGLVIADVDIPAGGVERIVSRIAAMPPEKRPIVLVVAASAEAARSLDVEIVQIVLRRPVNVSQIVELISSCIRSSSAQRPERNLEAGSSQDLDRARVN
jgi:DNA-binding NtrC family response regulator